MAEERSRNLYAAIKHRVRKMDHWGVTPLGRALGQEGHTITIDLFNLRGLDHGRREPHHRKGQTGREALRGQVGSAQQAFLQ